jgi:hypothetical protein
MSKKERPQNRHLKPIEVCDEVCEKGRNGGIRNGKKRRELSEIREWLKQDLFEQHKNSKCEKAETFKILFNKLKGTAISGNIKAMELYINYAGLKPIDKIEQTNIEHSLFTLLPNEYIFS